jgi:hypothetical protein
MIKAERKQASKFKRSPFKWHKINTINSLNRYLEKSNSAMFLLKLEEELEVTIVE